MSTDIVKKELPKLEELHYDITVAYKNDSFKLLLNQPPVATWVKKNPFVKDKDGNNADYLPINKVEYLLDRIFQEWRVEIKNVQQVFNSVVTTIRLHYKNPTTGEWQYHDGVGACQVQTKAGASPAELDKINNNAVQMAAPASKSYAIKDAAEHLGSLFGRDLNRKDLLPFAGSYAAAVDKNEALKAAAEAAEKLNKK